MSVIWEIIQHLLYFGIIKLWMDGLTARAQKQASQSAFELKCEELAASLERTRIHAQAMLDWLRSRL